MHRTSRLVGDAAPELVYATLARELASALGESEVGLGIWRPESESFRYWRNGRPPLDRKLELVARTEDTIVDLISTRHSLRVEWYIVSLIVLEILLTIYQLWLR